MKLILDRYISRHYDEVRTYTEYFLVKFKANMIADVVINNSYLYVAEISDDTKDENKVKSYLLNTIKKQIIWSTLHRSTNRQMVSCANSKPTPDR